MAALLQALTRCEGEIWNEKNTFRFDPVFISFFINMGMVTGILPVVGIPLPLVSYGGTSMVTMMASFGILMSIQTHRRLVTT